MRALALLLLLVTGCDRVFGLDRPDASPIGAYAYRKAITITPPTAARLTDVPIALVVEGMHANDLEAHSASGRDFLVTAADGITALPFELEKSDPMSGELVGWTKLPELSGATTVYLHYGGPDRPLVDRTVWRSEFAGVWHFARADGADISDSTSNGNTLIPATVGGTPDIVEGAIGAARSLDGDDDRLEAPDNPTLDAGMSSLTYSAWINVDKLSGMWDQALDHGGGHATIPGYNLELGTGEWNACISDGSTSHCVSFDVTNDLLRRWVHLAVVVDRAAGTFTAHVDGQARESRPLGIGSLSTANRPRPLSISNPAEVDTTFEGVIDEVRIYMGALSREWLQTEHANIAERATFLTVGAEEALH